jgi:hypothetical protein
VRRCWVVRCRWRWRCGGAKVSTCQRALNHKRTGAILSDEKSASTLLTQCHRWRQLQRLGLVLTTNMLSALRV